MDTESTRVVRLLVTFAGAIACFFGDFGEAR